MTLGAALGGAIGETMMRDAGWRFVEIGRRLERALYLVTMVRGLPAPPRIADRVTPPIDERRLQSAILALTEQRTQPTLPNDERDGELSGRAALIRAVLANESDPRSLTFQLAALAEHLSALPRPKEEAAGNRGLIELAVNYATMGRRMILEALAEGGRERGPGDGEGLQAVFGRLEMMLPQISDLMTQTYFTHVLARSA